MKIRVASREDLPAMVEIYNHAILHSTATFDTEPFEVAERVAWFEAFDDEHPLLVAVSGEEVLGYAYYSQYRARPAYRRTKELSVYVAESAQRRGVGVALYEALIAHARAKGVHTMIGVFSGDNPGSRALHRRLGFVEVGGLREVGHKFGQFLDTSFWQLLLEPPLDPGAE